MPCSLSLQGFTDRRRPLPANSPNRTLMRGVAGAARSIFHREPRLRATIELALFCFENQLNDTVIVRRSETVALGLHELGTSIFGLLACRVAPDHLSPDSGHAHVQIASS